MKNIIFVKNWVFTVLTFVFAFHHVSSSFATINCESNGNVAPTLPKAFSANIRINDFSNLYTVELVYATDGEGRELIEFLRHDRHVKYITRKDHKSVLYIQYREDMHPKCSTSKDITRKGFLDEHDAGEKNIILYLMEVMFFPNSFNLRGSGATDKNGIYAHRYQACVSEPQINVSMTFAVPDWKQTHKSVIIKDVHYPERVEAEIGLTRVVALYSYFDPTAPDAAMFEPPADIYCEGFRSEKKPPKLPDYFSYNAEYIEYQSSMGIAPVVNNRRVYYDFPSNISRMDYYELKTEDPDSPQDMFSRLTAREKSIIHDYNSGFEYVFDYYTGKCDIHRLKEKYDAICLIETGDKKMFNGLEYFWLNGSKTSYNGQFPVRGLIADVYTGVKQDAATSEKYVVSWWFSTEMIQIAETENVEKNVLLRMYVRPENNMDKQGVIEINFYNFATEEPDIFTYDLSRCFNESSSKTLVLTFPAFDSLRGSENMVGMLIHSQIREVTGIKKQRIVMREIVFNGGYMYAEFSLVEGPPDEGTEISLDDALTKLKDSVSSGKFRVNVQGSELQPEPDGLNVFAGDRYRKPEQQETGYKESSVISLTVGMLILGFVLGGVTLNLVMSRKFGISLFQKAPKGKSGFDNPLSEISMK